MSCQLLRDMDKDGAELIHKRGKGLRECLRGFKGELTMSINSTNFLKLLLVYEPSNF
jgi:hypothetical protein